MLYINIKILLFITYLSKLESNVLKLEFGSFNNLSSILGSNSARLIFRIEPNELFSESNLSSSPTFWLMATPMPWYVLFFLGFFVSFRYTEKWGFFV